MPLRFYIEKLKLNLFFVLILTCLIGPSSFAKTQCFLVVEKDKILHKEGNCNDRYAPCSTFKIAISLMGYDDGFLEDTLTPKLPFKKGYTDWLDRWKQSHTPKLWLQNSCVWYSQIITQNLGQKKFKNYVQKLAYGNQDVSGDIGKDNGLTNCWLSSSLEISPYEQITFLKKLLNNEHPVNFKAHEMTRKIMFVQALKNGWHLYGKTGNGALLAQDKIAKLDRQVGWFVGWIEKGPRKIVFAHLIVDDEKQDTYASLRAKSAAIAYLEKSPKTC